MPMSLDAAFAGGIDSVVHLAAVTSVLRSVENPVGTFETNVAGTHAVLEARAGGRRALARVRVDQRRDRSDGGAGDRRDRGSAAADARTARPRPPARC